MSLQPRPVIVSGYTTDPYPSAASSTQHISTPIKTSNDGSQSRAVNRGVKVVLIDGDGYKFDDYWIKRHALGGFEAGQHLFSVVSNLQIPVTWRSLTVDITHSNKPAENTAIDDQDVSTTSDMLIMIFCNLSGLRHAFIKRAEEGITHEAFTNFLKGLNKHPSLSVVDTGPDQNSADFKLIRHLRVFAKCSDVSYLVLGVMNDRIFASDVIELINTGRKESVVLLDRNYHIASDFQDFIALPVLTIRGLFRESEFPPKTTPLEVVDTAADEPNVVPAGLLEAGALYPTCGPKYGDGQGLSWRGSIHRMPVHLCNSYYLHEQGCPHGATCQYSREYNLVPAQMRELRVAAAASPCHWHRWGECNMGDTCPSAHRCPNGAQCESSLNGSCSFSKTPGAHDGENDGLKQTPAGCSGVN